MKILNSEIAIIVAACVVSSVHASSANPAVTTPPDSALMVSARIIENVPTFYPALTACLAAKSQCIDEFTAFESQYNAYKSEWDEKLRKQQTGLQVLCSKSDSSECRSVSNRALTVIKSEMDDLAAGSDAIREMASLKNNGGFNQNAVEASMAFFKRETNTKRQNLKARNYKTLLMAIKMFRNPSDASQDGINLAEYIKPDWKPELTKINVPDSRFKVIPIGASMNIEALKRQNPNDNAAAIFLKVKTNYETLKSSYAKTAMQSEIEILGKAIDVLDATTFESFKDRLIILERAVEGIIESLNSSLPVAPETATKFVKMWMYAKQIVEENGSVLFGLLELPAPPTGRKSILGTIFGLKK